VERERIQQLERVFPFKHFAEALTFTIRVGALAEAEGHHPANNGWLNRKQNPKPRLRGLRGVANEHKIRVIVEVQHQQNWSKVNTAGQTSQIGKMTAWDFEKLIDATIRVKCVLF